MKGVYFMAKSRDYIYMNVMNIQGKKIGYIKDLLVDFNKGEVIGFKINPYRLLCKDFNVLKENIIYYKSQLVINNIVKDKYLEFSTIMNIHVIDKCSNILGLVSEVIFDDDDFKIKGLVVKDYNIFNMFKSRSVLLKSDLIIGDEYILYTAENTNIILKCMPNIGNKKIASKDVYYEKD
jgi:sporulation protein YlmC with PRC-barrel domain